MLTIKGKIIATKPGHYINTEFARKISSVIEEALKERKKESKIGKAPKIEGKKQLL